MFNLDTVPTLKNGGPRLPSLFSSYETRTPHARWCNAFMAAHTFDDKHSSWTNAFSTYGRHTFLRLERADGGSERYTAAHYQGPLLSKVKKSKNEWEDSPYAWDLHQKYLMNYEGQDELQHASLQRDEVENLLAWWGTRRYERPLLLYKLQVFNNPTALSFLNSPAGIAVTQKLPQLSWYE